MTTRDDDLEPDSLGGTRPDPEAWLRARLPASLLGATARRIVNHLLTNPPDVVYATASDVAASVGASASGVTRVAQQLGFTGWPDLQRQMRARYLSRLALTDVADAHTPADTPFKGAILQDASALASVAREVDEAAVGRVVALLQSAERIFVTGMGSFAAVGQSFVHNLQLAGYPTQGLLDRPSMLANTVASMREGDVLVVCSYWRHYRVVVSAASAAKARGVTIVALADYLPARLGSAIDEAVLIPAESTSFFASLTVPMAVQQAIVSTLSRIDPDRTRRQLELAEELWIDFELLDDPGRP